MSDAQESIILKFRQRALNFLLRYWLIGLAFLLFLGLGWYWHNYSQPLVVEDVGFSRHLMKEVYQVQGKWEDLKGEPFEIPKYGFASPSLEQLVREGNFRLAKGVGKSRAYLTVEESIEILEGKDVHLIVILQETEHTRLARTGWLVWGQAYNRVAMVMVQVSMPRGGHYTGSRSSGIQIYWELDSDYHLPALMDAGRARHDGLVPAGISKPGRGRE